MSSTSSRRGSYRALYCLDTIGTGGFSRWRHTLKPSGRYVAPSPSGLDILWTLWSRITGSRLRKAMLFRFAQQNLALLAELAEHGAQRWSRPSTSTNSRRPTD